VICYTTAWIDLLVPFIINAAGVVINLFTGKWLINSMYVTLYYVLAGAIVLATILDITPRARRSTRGEGAEKGWFYVTVWMVVPTQIIAWAMWRLGRLFALSPAGLDHLRIATFLLVASFFLLLGLLGKLPRTQRYHVPRGMISDMEVSAGA